MAAHVGTLLGSAVPLGNLLAPLGIWLFHRNTSGFVGKHARESLGFQVGLTVAVVALLLLVAVTRGAGLLLALPGLLALLIGDFLYMVLATIRANEGKIWEYPVTSRFVS